METTTKSGVREITWPGKSFITKRARVRFSDLSKFFTETYGSIYKALKKAGLDSKEAPYAIYHSIDEKKMETDLSAAVPVTGAFLGVEGYETVNIPSARALLFEYYGSYENMRPAYDALGRYVSDHHLKTAWMIEQYLSDPTVEKDPANWKTNIYWILK